MSKPKRLLIVGPSCSGKGFGAGHPLRQRYPGLSIFETGVWSRIHRKKLSSAGVLVDDTAINDAVREDFASYNGEHYGVDSPRSLTQVHEFISMFYEKDPDAEIHTIHLDTPRAICEIGIIHRADRENRPDDKNPASIKKKLDIYFANGGLKDTIVPYLAKHTRYHHIRHSADIFAVRKDVIFRIGPAVFGHIGQDVHLDDLSLPGTKEQEKEGAAA